MTLFGTIIHDFIWGSPHSHWIKWKNVIQPKQNHENYIIVILGELKLLLNLTIIKGKTYLNQLWRQHK